MTYALLKRRESAAVKPKASKPVAARTPAKSAPEPAKVEHDTTSDSQTPESDVNDTEVAEGLTHTDDLTSSEDETAEAARYGGGAATPTVVRGCRSGPVLDDITE